MNKADMVAHRQVKAMTPEAHHSLVSSSLTDDTNRGEITTRAVTGDMEATENA
jgi:hypothetical protein